MAFCTKCGKEIGPDGKCDCEKVQTTSTQETPAAQTGGSDAPATEKSGKRGILIAVAAVAVVVLCVLLFGGGNYKTPLKELEKLVNEQNTNVFAYTELLQNPMDSTALTKMWKILKKSSDYEDMLVNLQDGLEEFYEDAEGLKISFDITDAEKLDKSDLKKLNKRYKNSYKNFKDVLKNIEDMDKGDYEDLADSLDISIGDAKKFVKQFVSYMESYDKVEVSKGYEVELRCYGEMDGDEGKTDRFTVTVLKIDGKWFIEDGTQIFGKISFDDDLSGASLYNLSRMYGMNIGSLGLY